MVSKTREVMMYKNSKDPKVVTASKEVHPGRRWNASLELQIVEERLMHKALMGRLAVIRTGLGYCTNKDTRGVTGKETPTPEELV